MTATTWLLTISRLVERTAFYLFLGTIIHFLLGEPALLASTEAFFYYGFAMFVLTSCYLVGGLLGDLVTGNRPALYLGLILALLGFVLLATVHFETWYLPLSLTAGGIGIYGPNLMALYAREYTTAPARSDAGFSILYVALNLAGLLAAMTGLALMPGNFRTIFIICMVLIILASVLLFFISDKPVKAEADLRRPSEKIAGFWIVIALLLPGLIVMAMKLPSSYLTEITRPQPTGSADTRNTIQDFLSLASVLAGSLLAWMWLKKKIPGHIKLITGILIGGITAFLPFIANGSGIFTIYVLMAAVADFLVIPTAQGMISRYTNPRFFAFTFAALSIYTFAIARLSPNIITRDSLSSNEWFQLSAPPVILLLTGILGLAFLKPLTRWWRQDSANRSDSFL